MKNLITPFLILLFLSNFLSAQELVLDTTTDTVAKKEKRISFAPIPYIGYDRSLGFSIGAVPMIMYNLNQKDTISPQSLTGLIGFYTTNKTWMGMVFSKLYLNEDKYRAKIAGGLGNVNFQFFIDDVLGGSFIDYNTTMNFIFAELQRKVIGDLYLGLNASYSRLITDYDIEGVEDDISYLKGLGAIMAYDVRDDVYYPTQGFFGNLKYNSFPEFMGNEMNSNKISIDYNHFFGMRNKKDVLAIRAFAGAGIGDLDFNQQYVVGQTDIRGYTQGVYRGKQQTALQAEYRWNTFDKLGFVGFAGVTSVFNGINESDNGKLLPGAGVGFRYTVMPDNHLNVGLDGAVGIEDWGIYFRIGETF
jgi:outer membrane protein assembly factor BamA